MTEEITPGSLFLAIICEATLVSMIFQVTDTSGDSVQLRQVVGETHLDVTGDNLMFTVNRDQFLGDPFMCEVHTNTDGTHYVEVPSQPKRTAMHWNGSPITRALGRSNQHPVAVT